MARFPPGGRATLAPFHPLTYPPGPSVRIRKPDRFGREASHRDPTLENPPRRSLPVMDDRSPRDAWSPVVFLADSAPSFLTGPSIVQDGSQWTA